MRASRLFFLLFICFHALYTSAQSSNNSFKAPDIIPRSPEAASLGRYGEIPVGEYTGAADISIPLHVVKGGKLSFPISLSYNSTGIRVAQEATWVGLGWDISAVAGITYAPVGGNDQTYTVYTPWSDVKTMIDYLNPQKTELSQLKGEDRPTWCDGYVGPYDGWMTKMPENALGYAKGAKSALDLFDVHCMNLSFKFYINPETNQPKVYGDKNNYKIEIINGNINNGFKITDDNGIMYFFSAIEQTSGPNAVNAWYITEIRRADGDWIKFTYSNFGAINPLPSLSQQYIPDGCASAEFVASSGFHEKTFQSSPDAIQNQYLTKIESATELVQFNLASDRVDLRGGGARRLESIQITDKFSGHSKSFSFEYGYFEGTNTGGNYLYGVSMYQDVFTTDQLSKRLKLLSVTENDANANKNAKYTFSYDETTALPYKTSYAVDHWGFYNGQEQATFIPKLFSLFLYDPVAKNKVGAADQFQSGAYRGCNKDYVGAGTLKSITYPTGGKTVFTFEPNSFGGYNILSAGEEKYIRENISNAVTSWDFNNSPGSYSSSFTLTDQTVVNFTGNINNKNNHGGLFDCNQMAGTSIVLFCGNCNYPVTTWTIGCGDFDQNGNLNKSWNQQLTLPAGTYALITSLPDNLGFQGYTPLVVASITYQSMQAMNQVLANHTESIGGGLRIKKVENYVQTDQLTSSKEYRYINENGTTSGKLIAPLRYTQTASNYYKGQVNSGTSTCAITSDNTVVFTSNAISPVATSPIRSQIGYSRVEIIDKDLSDQAANGKVIKTFRNELAASYFENIVLNDAISNGDLLSASYMTAAGSKVKDETYVYDNTAVEKDWINLKLNDLYTGSFDCSCSMAFYGYDYKTPQFKLAQFRYFIAVFPYVNYKTTLTQKTEVDYVPTGSITTQTNYEYNLNNYEVSKITTTNSKGDQNVTTIKYPDDYKSVSSLYSDMVNANMVSLPVETIKYKGQSEQLERTTTNYGLVDNFYIEPVSVERQLRNSAPSTLIIYGRYSEGGNIAEYKTANGMYVSTIWGYGSTLPIAYVENARRSNIFYTGFEEGDGNSADNDSKTGLKSHTGAYSNQLTIDNGNYIFSYWLKSGTDWMLNTQTVTVTSGSYTIAFTSGQQVDDVRFYPVNSYMKTYTYEPTVGMTSATDINNRPNYYEYDAFGRLSIIRDKDRNILKKICYHYAGLPEACPVGVGNVQKSATFTRNNCSTGNVGESITYTVAANTYFAATQQDADALAQNDLNAKGQAYANENGGCTKLYYNVAKSATFTKNDCSAGSVPGSIVYTVAAGKYLSTASQDAADQLALNDLNANGQAYANNNGNCTWYNVVKSGNFTKNDCPSGYTPSSVTYTVNAGKYSSTTSQADADQQAQNDVNANGQTNANNLGTCTAPAPCSLSINSNYFFVGGSISNNGTTATLGLAFYGYNTINPGTPYVIGTINGGCRPSGSRTLTFSSNSRSWTLTIDPGGNMTLVMTSGTALTTRNVISVGTQTYNL